LAMSKERVKGFNYHFFKFDHGPISKQIYEDGECLVASGLVSGLKNAELTERGQRTFGSLQALYEENKAVTDYIDKAAAAYGRLGFGSLKKRIYALKVIWAGEEWTIADIPLCTDVLDKVEAKDAATAFVIDDDWVDSLWGTFHYTEEQAQKLRVIHRVA